MMIERTLREQIQIYWQKQLGEVLQSGATYTVLTQIGLGIEFLGKCLDTETTWNQIGFSETHFNLALTELDSLNIYKFYANIENPKATPGSGQLKDINVTTFCSNQVAYDIEKNLLDVKLKNYSKQVLLDNPVVPPPATTDDEKVRNQLDSLSLLLHHIELDLRNAELECEKILEAEKHIKNMKSLLTLPPPAANNNFDLYKCLRCGMAHAGFPGYKLKLTSYTDKKIYEDADGFVVLDATRLYEDFNKACGDLIDLAEKKRPELKKRLDDVVMFIEEIPQSTPEKQYICDGNNTFPDNPYGEPQYECPQYEVLRQDGTSATSPKYYG